MTQFFVVLLITAITFLLLWAVLSRRKGRRNDPPVFICSHCGERHCECHKDPGKE